MIKLCKGDGKSVLSAVAFVGGTAAISVGIALAGSGIASADASPIDTQIGNAGNYYNTQAGNLGNFVEKQVGDAGNFYSVNAGRALSGLLSSLAGKHHAP